MRSYKELLNENARKVFIHTKKSFFHTSRLIFCQLPQSAKVCDEYDLHKEKYLSNLYREKRKAFYY